MVRDVWGMKHFFPQMKKNMEKRTHLIYQLTLVGTISPPFHFQHNRKSLIHMPPLFTQQVFIRWCQNYKLKMATWRCFLNQYIQIFFILCTSSIFWWPHIQLVYKLIVFPVGFKLRVISNRFLNLAGIVEIYQGFNLDIM